MPDKNNIKFTIIGIGNTKEAFPANFNLEMLTTKRIFSGGKRHYNLVKDFLPQDHEWINISGNIDEVIKIYQSIKEPITVFASGDPFFYGFGNTLKRMLPKSEINSFPYLNSLQLLANRTNTNYGESKMISVHGRSWKMLDTALIKNEPLIGVLTDQHKNPATIAKRLLTYGFDNYRVVVGENIEGEKEKISLLNLHQASNQTFDPLNCLFLQQTRRINMTLGIPETEFEPLNGRPNLITKMPVRLATMHALDLSTAKNLWDIGACTGSVSIEAKRLYPHLNITAFEKRTECKDIIINNTKTNQSPGIEMLMGNFPEIVPQGTPKPDRVFIGGHGGKLRPILLYINNLIVEENRIVINAVKAETILEFKEIMAELNYELLPSMRLQLNNSNPIEILTGIKR